MNLMLFFYLIEVMDKLSVIAIIAIVSTLVVAFMGAMVWGDSRDDHKVVPHLKKCAIIVFIMSFVFILVPSKQTMYLMAGSKVVTDIASNDRVKSIAGSSMDLIENKIKEYTEESKKVTK